jgi:hypothetical protein
MHNNENTNKSSFIESSSKVETFLRQKFDELVSTLSNKELKKYAPLHNFVRGWRLRDDDSGVNFKILLPENFPFATPRIAIEDILDKNKDFSVSLPHVEDAGLLCLPALNASLKNPEGLINELLQRAIKFIKEFSVDPEKVGNDFKEEFISYWTRHKSKNSLPILSLLKADSDSCEISYCLTKEGQYLVGNSVSDIRSWYKNRFTFSKEPIFSKGLFIKLREPFVPPFPSNIKELELLIESNTPEVLPLFQSNILNVDPYLIIFSAQGKAGIGLFGVCINRVSGTPDPIRGYRGTYYMSKNLKIVRANESTQLTRRQIVRVDHDWIHGRGKDVTQEILKKASVMILGCGSLGSHIAVRLAQAGIGKITLVDPEELETANVGRHVLGVKHVRQLKVKGLMDELGERFPHIEISSFAGNWQSFFKKYPDAFNDTNLIISALGDWGGEGVLNEWHLSKKLNPPIIYGWLEERASVAHAVLIKESGSCFGCLIGDQGEMKNPDSGGWRDTHGLLSEPACGSVFQPYGPIDLAFAEALVSELSVSVLTGEQIKNVHRVHAISEERMRRLGGIWTSNHLKWRPKGFTGSFQYECPLIPDFDCHFCSKKYE